MPCLMTSMSAIARNKIIISVQKKAFLIFFKEENNYQAFCHELDNGYT